MFQLQFETDNDAFSGNLPAIIAAVLREVAAQLYNDSEGHAPEPQTWERIIRDSNGNLIGSYIMVED